MSEQSATNNSLPEINTRRREISTSTQKTTQTKFPARGEGQQASDNVEGFRICVVGISSDLYGCPCLSCHNLGLLSICSYCCHHINMIMRDPRHKASSERCASSLEIKQLEFRVGIPHTVFPYVCFEVRNDTLGRGYTGRQYLRLTR